jgi:branched-chain amino acid transport system permease protein
VIYLGAVVDGFLLGGLFAGVAVGFSLVFGIANLLNLAHGAFIVLGAYIILALQQALGMNIFVAAPISAAIAFLLGWSIYRWGGLAMIIRAPLLMVIVFTFGLNLVIVHGIGFAFGARSQSIRVPDFINDVWVFGSVIVPVSRFYAAIAGVLLAFGVDWVLRFTKLGRAIRATRQDREMAGLNGVDVNKIYAATVGIGAATAAFAGALIAVGQPITPDMSIHYLLISFAVAIIGGFGRIDAVIMGGVVYGMLLGVAQVGLGEGLGNAAALALLFVLLLVRPYGLFGSQYY